MNDETRPDPASWTDEERRAKGKDLGRTLFTGAPRVRRMPAEAERHYQTHLFGDVWQDSTLTFEERSLMTCALLVAQGREFEQKLHFRGARNLGIDRAKLEAMITHVIQYAGWPVGSVGFRALAEVWETMDDEEGSGG